MATKQGSERKPKYDRRHLVDLLGERAAFESAAVRLYDAVLEALRSSKDPRVASSIPTLARHRDEEQAHAAWVARLIMELGGQPSPDLPQVVMREARALEEVVVGHAATGELIPIFHAMLASELMDVEGWKLLLEIAEDLGDEKAADRLRIVVDREDEHLLLVREMLLTLERDVVRYERAPASAPL